MRHKREVSQGESQNQQGSGLLATILLVATIGVIIASMSRLAIESLGQVTSFEESSMAYAAAEAGIEEGLLRWRYDRSIEIPDVPGGMDRSQFLAQRVNLATGQVAGQVTIAENLGSARTEMTDPLYDVRVWYKVPSIGNPDEMGQPHYAERLAKDGVLELDVTELAGETIQIFFRTNDGSQTQLETRVLAYDDETGSISDACADCKIIHPPVFEGAWEIAIPPVNPLARYTLRIRPFILNADGTPAPDTSSIDYAIRPLDPTLLMDSGTTYIESTGYFAESQRKLLITIDRASGTILNNYDYALFVDRRITVE